MRCIALRGFYLADTLVPKGAEVDVPDHLVRQLALVGKIAPAPEPAPVPQPKPIAAKPAKPAKPEPMTTFSAPALVPGADPEKETHHD